MNVIHYFVVFVDFSKQCLLLAKVIDLGQGRCWIFIIIIFSQNECTKKMWILAQKEKCLNCIILIRILVFVLSWVFAIFSWHDIYVSIIWPVPSFLIFKKKKEKKRENNCWLINKRYLPYHSYNISKKKNILKQVYIPEFC